jgi:hypothetical protein
MGGEKAVEFPAKTTSLYSPDTIWLLKRLLKVVFVRESGGRVGRKGWGEMMKF